MQRGEWYQCQSCGEESIYTGRDPVDFVCSVCGCCAAMLDAEIYDGRQLDFVSRT